MVFMSKGQERKGEKSPIPNFPAIWLPTTVPSFFVSLSEDIPCVLFSGS